MPARKKSPQKKKVAPDKVGSRLPLAIVVLALLATALVFLAHRQEARPRRPTAGDSVPTGTAPAPPAQQPVAKKAPALPVPAEKQQNRPQVAIVMDDLGRSLDFGEALLQVDVPVTFAILPGEPHATALAEMAHRHGREILIHVPMEPQGYPLTDPGDDALLVAMPTAEIRRRVEDFRLLVPHAVGGNNHMGSRFTEQAEGMRAVLATFKEADLFFLDSLTSRQSVAYAEARQAQIPAAVRDVFLDNDQEVEKIAGEIRRLVQVARRQGRAIGICHPYPQTLEALRRMAGELRQAGVDLVPVGALVVR